jgi:hypothetical protein
MYCDNEYCRDDIFKLRIEFNEKNNKKLRRSLYQEFYNNNGLLTELNQKVRQIKGTLFQYGSMYSCFEKINIAVITRSDDPMNILIPEITLLFKSMLAEDFKIISIDLYTLFSEKGDDDSFGYSSAVSAAFFREIESFQKTDYRFEAPLEVLNEGIKLPVTNNKRPIFDLVYLLSDRNEDGIIVQNSMVRNYQIIAYIVLLKNKNIDTENEPENGVYNNEQFRQGISGDMTRQVYATAGLSKLRRPNNAIALTVLYHYNRLYIQKLKKNIELDKDQILKLLHIDELSLLND